MTKNNNNRKDGKVTASDLFGRLRAKTAPDENGSAPTERRPLKADFPEEELPDDGFSIDLSSDEESDSELDINELLRKYMPEYSEEKSNAESGVLSRLKKSTDGAESSADDDRLISALDSAFGPAGDDEFEFADGDEAPSKDSDSDVEEDYDDYDELPEPRISGRRASERRTKEKSTGLFSLFGKKRRRPSETIEEMPEDAEESERIDDVPVSADLAERVDRAEDERVPETGSDVARDKESAPILPEENVGFRTADLQLSDVAELESILQEPQPGNRISPTTGKPSLDDDDLLSRLEEFENAARSAESSPEEIPDELKFDETGKSTEASPEEIPDELKFAEIGETTEASPEEILDELKFGETEEATNVEENSEEIDPTDLNLRVAFGMDDGKKDGFTAAKQFGDQLEARQQKHAKRTKLDRPEFVDKTQIPKIRKEYKRRRALLCVRIVLCALFTGLLMIFENLGFFTALFTGVAQAFGGVFDPAVYPVVYIMTSLQLMLLACLCAYEQIIDGFRYVFRGVPKAESMTALLFTGGVLYSVILARVIETPNEPVMFNFVVALSALLTLVYAFYNTNREKMNFDVVSSRKTKHIVRRLPDEESRGEAQAFMEQTDVCDVMKIEKTDFVDGFFGRLYRPDSTVTVCMTCMLGIAVVLAVLFGFFIRLRGGEAEFILRVAYLALVVVAPTSILITFSYPFYRATVAAKELDSAIIGEASLAEYSNASIISFDDKNVFPSYGVKIQNIKIYNNARVDRVLYYAASVFAYAGGPLQDVFEVTTLDMGHSTDVKIFDTAAGFLAAQVNGVNIIFGSYRALIAKGFDIPEECAADDVDFSSELSIMYMFREDKLVAKMYVKYVMDGDVDLILKQFQGTGLYVCVRTFDPNIDERMIAKKLNMKKIPLRVVRYASAEEIGAYEEKVDSGLATCSSPKSLLQAVAYCDKALHARKINIALSALSVVIGAALLFLMILAGAVGTVNSLFVGAYHLLWIVPMVVSVKMTIR